MKEKKIYDELLKNNGKRTEEFYLMTAELLKDDDEKIDKVKKLLEDRVLKQIQSIFNRLSPECNMDEQSFIDWVCYIYDLED